MVANPGQSCWFAAWLASSHQTCRGPSEVARRLRVSRTWLYDAAKHGRIPCVRIGGPDGPLRFIAEDIDRWINAARAGWRPTDTARATLQRAATRQRPPATALSLAARL
ncbi:MAG: Helix-turn-helix domain [Solirubrobacteraceae bacterium]|nr:Helix-turn-helix domain [Solirubrobacteraceae bacterium]